MSDKPKKPLSEQIETIVTPNTESNVDFGTMPIPEALMDHLEQFFSELNLDPLPEYDLMSQEGALAAKENSEKVLKDLQLKMKQIEKLKSALLSAQPTTEKIVK
jgi:hypothetical protein